MTRRSLSVSCTASLALYILGYGVFLASFTLAKWVTYEAEHPDDSYSYGLWWNCSTLVGEYVCQPFEISDLSGNWIAVQSFFIVAVILAFVAGTIYSKVPVNAVFQIISGVGILLSTIIFATSVPLAPGEELDFAFMLAPVSGVMLLGNGLLLAISVAREGCTMDDVMPPERGQKQPKIV